MVTNLNIWDYFNWTVKKFDLIYSFIKGFVMFEKGFECFEHFGFGRDAWVSGELSLPFDDRHSQWLFMPRYERLQMFE